MEEVTGVSLLLDVVAGFGIFGGAALVGFLIYKLTSYVIGWGAYNGALKAIKETSEYITLKAKDVISFERVGVSFSNKPVLSFERLNKEKSFCTRAIVYVDMPFFERLKYDSMKAKEGKRETKRKIKKNESKDGYNYLIERLNEAKGYHKKEAEICFNKAEHLISTMEPTYNVDEMKINGLLDSFKSLKERQQSKLK